MEGKDVNKMGSNFESIKPSMWFYEKEIVKGSESKSSAFPGDSVYLHDDSIILPHEIPYLPF